jgi:hypothetical protein
LGSPSFTGIFSKRNGWGSFIFPLAFKTAVKELFFVEVNRLRNALVLIISFHPLVNCPGQGFICFTALQLHSFTASQLYGFIALLAT